MSRGRCIRAGRALAAALLCATAALPLVTVDASGQSLGDLRERMDALQARLTSLTRRVDDLYAREGALDTRIAAIERRAERARARMTRLRRAAIERANALYRSGRLDFVEALFEADSFGELSARAEMLAQVSADETAVFTTLDRTSKELAALDSELEVRREQLSETRSRLADASNALQAQFDEVADDYEALKRRLAAEARAERVVPAAPAPASAAPAPRPPSGGMACPVDGPHAFTDTWGAPRSGGRSHQGVDMMAAYGTPVAAIVSGTITYAGYGSSAGNWQILSGDDGNAYWYMHNQDNLVTGGRVSAGRHIATVGDTGNATGTPHLHFEYHPGGGAAVNPTPLVASVC